MHARLALPLHSAAFLQPPRESESDLRARERERERETETERERESDSFPKHVNRRRCSVIGTTTVLSAVKTNDSGASMPAITRRNAARHVIAVTPTPGRSLSLLTPRLPVHSPLSFSFHSTVLPFPPSLTHSTHAPVLGRSRGKTGFVLAPVEHQSTGSRIRSFATSHLARLLQTAVYPSPLSQPVIFPCSSGFVHALAPPEAATPPLIFAPHFCCSGMQGATDTTLSVHSDRADIVAGNLLRLGASNTSEIVQVLPCVHSVGTGCLMA